MTPEQAIRKFWPAGNPNMDANRVAVCAEKVRAKLDEHGFACACNGSYSHLAMEIVAGEQGLSVVADPGTETVTLVASN